jgi:fibronectin type 3 domain-containing protein
MELLADNVEAPSYSDRKVTGNQTYRYSVTAVDQVNNESGKSQPFEIKTR